MRVVAFLLLIVSGAAAQNVQVVYSNLEFSGMYPGSILTSDQQLAAVVPLAQGSVPTAGSETFQVTSQPMPIHMNGEDYLVWWENFQKAVFLGKDDNGNGALDPVEIEKVWTAASFNAPSMSSLSMLVIDDDIFLANSAGSSNRGIIKLEDLDGDRDFFDPGEAVEVLNSGVGGPGATRTVGGVTIMTGQVVELMSTGTPDTLVFRDQLGSVFYKLNLLSMQIDLFLNFNAAFSAEAALLPHNILFDTLPLPGTNGQGTLSVSDSSVEDGKYFFAVENDAGDRRVFVGEDLNGDCDINDPGELGIFADAAIAIDGSVTLEDLAVQREFAMIVPPSALGSLPVTDVYAFVEHGTSGQNPSSIYRFADLNGDGDAMDANEAQLVFQIPAGLDPKVGGFSVFPAGTFPSQCVRFACNNTVVRSTGGTMRFVFRDVPALHFTGADIGVVVLSLAAPGLTSLTADCSLGVVLDTLSLDLLAIVPYPFLTSPITSSFAQTPLFPYPPGLPVGFQIPFAAIVAGPGGISASHTSKIVVAP